MGSVEDARRVERLTRTALDLPADAPSNLLPPRHSKPGDRRKVNRDGKSVPDSEKPAEQNLVPAAKKFKSSLTADDMDDIIMEKQLSDKHITFAQNLLKSQFENINGLECTLIQSKNSVLTEDATKNKLQIFHDRDMTIGLLHPT